ncbi:hypothetical protein NEUTE1DRAFT_118996 [Neurospora tetrasperma FGSC 2508]|uniref:Uncharacterized protein n=1 Tax=Neurospora tetrasperma (strain FGSC 2508 / ATCC MYA-4615 / P0657) TaxID=510951 RepID=F8MZX9_NEUT8|nr:uncharacterized protein NEUTE1DRAFT_118996 [Neurospora tetrasperma FGSC 2508]EGO52914.1 hypothetical protein NEUTE1DRAFT_118996 [Neurospora tetrasperma FGSC 2508]
MHISQLYVMKDMPQPTSELDRITLSKPSTCVHLLSLCGGFLTSVSSAGLHVRSFSRVQG